MACADLVDDLADVEPGEIRSLRFDIFDERHVRADVRLDEVVVAIDVGDHLIEPILAFGQRGTICHHAQRIQLHVIVRFHAGDIVGVVREEPGSLHGCGLREAARMECDRERPQPR